MHRLVLWRLRASPPSNAVVMLGELLKLNFEYKEPNIQIMEHKSPAFKKINPTGTVPVLQDDDFVLNESHAIMKYLLTRYGREYEERLYPSETKARALVDQALFFDAGYMFIKLKNVALPTIMSDLASPTPQHLADIDEAYQTLEGHLRHGPYIAGDHLTIADLSLGSTVTATSLGVKTLDPNKCPRAAEWLSRLEQEPVFQKINTPGAQRLAKTLKARWETNSAKIAQ